MDTVLKFDRVVLVKEMNDKFKKVGDVFEIANILDNSFLLRDSKTRVALGVVSFEDFERCFVAESQFTGWTAWTQFVGFDNQNDIFYRTNRRKTQVKFTTNKIKAESCCHKADDFNLYLGIQMAYLRCLNKALLKQKSDCEKILKNIELEINENQEIIKKMISSLE